jgi:16S rRNA (uracil1498-N3)-methyltransferase
MTRRRWIADEVSGDRASLIGDHADHLIRVLRARVGDHFDIATGAAVRSGRVASIANGRVEFTLSEEIPGDRLSEITLALSIFKFDRMEWAIEKCTELGVSRVVPVIARRTDSHLAAASVKRVERWQRITRQASEQSRRVLAPEVAVPIEVAEALNIPGRLRILLSEVEDQTLLRDVVKSDAPNGGVVLAIGPEGGWTEGELQAFHRAGWISASLGSTILRAETAAIAAMAVLASVLSSF